METNYAPLMEGWGWATRLELGCTALLGNTGERSGWLAQGCCPLLGLFPPCLQGRAQPPSGGQNHTHPQLSQEGLLCCTPPSLSPSLPLSHKKNSEVSPSFQICNQKAIQVSTNSSLCGQNIVNITRQIQRIKKLSCLKMPYRFKVFLLFFLMGEDNEAQKCKAQSFLG